MQGMSGPQHNLPPPVPPLDSRDKGKGPGLPSVLGITRLAPQAQALPRVSQSWGSTEVLALPPGVGVMP